MHAHHVLLMAVIAAISTGALAAQDRRPGAAPSPENVSAVSPDGRLAITLAVNHKGALAYHVSLNGKPVVTDSSLGLTLENGGAFANLREVGQKRDRG